MNQMTIVSSSLGVIDAFFFLYMTYLNNVSKFSLYIKLTIIVNCVLVSLNFP